MNHFPLRLASILLACLVPLADTRADEDEIDTTALLANPSTESIVDNPQRATMRNGDEIEYAVFGDSGPFVFLGPQLYITSFMPGATDITMAYIDALSDRYRVIIANWPRGMGGSSPAIGSWNTAENAVDDIHHIADAAGAETFAWWGYSYGGAVGLQLAARSDRVSALVVGGYPPAWQPISDMLMTTRRMKAQLQEQMGEEAGPYLETAEASITFYDSIANIDQDALLASIKCPRMVYHDVDDTISLGGLTHDLSARTRASQEQLEAMGWEVHWMETGQAHMGMSVVQPNLDAFVPFLDKVLLNAR
jgi:pimeloyl-ACP methyl ester carboxylesterase